LNGHVTVYDTLDHQISGVSQQQGRGGSLTLTSQRGTVSVSTLPVVSVDGAQAKTPEPRMAPAGESYRPDSAQETDLFAKIERLAELHKKGILSSEESQPRRPSFSPGCERESIDSGWLADVRFGLDSVAKVESCNGPIFSRKSEAQRGR
jgi:hypothetical protein